MPRYRVTLLFEKKAGDPVGHAERWDFLADNNAAATTLARQVASRRAQFLPLDWKVRSVRIGTLTPFEVSVGNWRFKQVSVGMCSPPTNSGTLAAGEIDGGAVYYRFHYTDKPGKDVVRLFTPVYESYWDGSSTGGRDIQSNADGDVQPWIRWLQGKQHKLFVINKTTGSVAEYSLECGTFQRAAIKKIGRPFFLRRGRRFAHRTP